MSGVTNEEDKKPAGDQGAHINLKVKGQDGNEVFFRIKRSTQLKKLMNAYCDRQSVELNSIAFLFDVKETEKKRVVEGVGEAALLIQNPLIDSPEKMSGVNNDEDKKPGTGGDQGAHINLKVKGQDGNEVFFRIKRSTQLKKLMNAYCDRQSVELNSIAFLFDGRRLRGEQTPDEDPLP
ncbi:Small ubiquitin-related modifier, SUMO, partial [Cynara cardunculus var. scolymus]